MTNTANYFLHNYTGFCWKIKDESVVTIEQKNVVIYNFKTNSTTIEFQLSTDAEYLTYYNSKYYYIVSNRLLYEYNTSSKISTLIKTFDIEIAFCYFYKNCIYYNAFIKSSSSIGPYRGVSVFDLDKKLNIDTDTIFPGSSFISSQIKYFKLKYAFYFNQKEENYIPVEESANLSFLTTLPNTEFPININGATYNFSENVIVDNEIKPANTNFVLANGKEIKVSPVINNISGTIKLPNN